MLIELGNLVAGFHNAAPAIKRVVPATKDFVNSVEENLKPWTITLGWFVLIVGVVTVLDRIFSNIPTYYIGHAGFPQGLLAIANGLILLKDQMQVAGLRHLGNSLAQYKEIIGAVSILAALYRLI
jgi:hypothetical protein